MVKKFSIYLPEYTIIKNQQTQSFDEMKKYIERKFDFILMQNL
jgi:hypothetical protein